MPFGTPKPRRFLLGVSRLLIRLPWTIVGCMRHALPVKQKDVESAERHKELKLHDPLAFVRDAESAERQKELKVILEERLVPCWIDKHSATCGVLVPPAAAVQPEQVTALILRDGEAAGLTRMR